MGLATEADIIQFLIIGAVVAVGILALVKYFNKEEFEKLLMLANKLSN